MNCKEKYFSKTTVFIFSFLASSRLVSPQFRATIQAVLGVSFEALYPIVSAFPEYRSIAKLETVYLGTLGTRGVGGGGGGSREYLLYSSFTVVLVIEVEPTGQNIVHIKLRMKNIYRD